MGVVVWCVRPSLLVTQLTIAQGVIVWCVVCLSVLSSNTSCMNAQAVYDISEKSLVTEHSYIYKTNKNLFFLVDQFSEFVKRIYFSTNFSILFVVNEKVASLKS